MDRNLKSELLAVDLDGTLLHTDMLHESAFGLLKAAPLSVVKALCRLVWNATFSFGQCRCERMSRQVLEL